MKIESSSYNGEGMKRVYENEQWTVGIKNWKPSNDVTEIDCLERHNLTDELFVLISGHCTLIFANELQGKLSFDAVEMKPNQVYTIPKTLWHNTITQKDTKMILIENVSTSMDNSDLYQLSPEEIREVRALAK
ncbi:MAG: cupin [Candidatus Pacebacteria bacterium]|nr:cupin [Candidatus Paceibacterota bacterium]